MNIDRHVVVRFSADGPFDAEAMSVTVAFGTRERPLRDPDISVDTPGSLSPREAGKLIEMLQAAIDEAGRVESAVRSGFRREQENRT